MEAQTRGILNSSRNQTQNMNKPTNKPVDNKLLAHKIEAMVSKIGRTFTGFQVGLQERALDNINRDAFDQFQANGQMREYSL